jgi:dCTP deaminase
MILPDHEIRKLLDEGRIKIEPLENPKVQIQPAGVDLRLGNEFRIFKVTSTPYIDIKKKTENYTEIVNVLDGEQFIIHPGEFVLGIVKEYIKVPEDIMGSVDGRSSLGRLGISIHATSASINPGWEGRFVLEISNMGRMPVALYPGMRIAKLTLHKLSSPAEMSYDKRESSLYHKQGGVENSKIHEEDK